MYTPQRIPLTAMTFLQVRRPAAPAAPAVADWAGRCTGGWSIERAATSSQGFLPRVPEDLLPVKIKQCTSKRKVQVSYLPRYVRAMCACLDLLSTGDSPAVDGVGCSPSLLMADKHLRLACRDVGCPSTLGTL